MRYVQLHFVLSTPRNLFAHYTCKGQRYMMRHTSDIVKVTIQTSMKIAVVHMHNCYLAHNRFVVDLSTTQTHVAVIITEIKLFLILIIMAIRTLLISTILATLPQQQQQQQQRRFIHPYKGTVLRMFL